MESARLAYCFIALAVCLPASLHAAAARSAPTRPTAKAENTAAAYKGAIIVDAATGRTLFEDNADIVSPPASMTKLMTFAVLADKLASGDLTLQTKVTITKADAGMGGTQVYLAEKEVFPVEDLIYAMMIQSANDAAYALGRTAGGGSVPAFVDLMNAKARDLGMTHTTFRTPHGLPPGSRREADGDLTTPRDFSLLCRYLIAKTDVLKYTSVRQRSFGSPPRPKPIDMVNHDNLLDKFAGLDGLKTGFTNGAGFCLSATAQRNDRRVIVVTMGGTESKARDLKVAELLERGFALLPKTVPVLPLNTTPGTPAAASAPASAALPITKAPPPPAGESDYIIRLPATRK